jgi:hypothetical protein
LRDTDVALSRERLRVQMFVADADDWPSISSVFATALRDIRPTLTATVSGMIVPRIKLEIGALHGDATLEG